MIGKEEIDHRFGFHKATIEGENATAPDHELLRQLFKRFAGRLDEILEDGRAKSIAFTHLEDASMWAHKCVSSRATLVDERG